MAQRHDSDRIPGSLGKPRPRDRPLIDRARAGELSRLFKTLASDTRLRLLHALEREGELCVSEICSKLAMKPQALSNQLRQLSDRRVLDARREGTRIYYRIADPCVAGLLDLGFCLLEETHPQSVRRLPTARRTRR